MREELYKIKCPRHIVFGDPMYFEDYEGKRLEELIVNYKPPQHFEAGVVLREEVHTEYAGVIMRTMSIYLAPKETLGTYMSGMIYEGQQMEQKEIGVDSASYVIHVDDRQDEIKTGGDGYWGEIETLYRKQGQQTSTNAVIVHIAIPDFVDFKEMQQWVHYFFEDATLQREEKPKDKPLER